jgi:hypothetical protein
MEMGMGMGMGKGMERRKDPSFHAILMSQLRFEMADFSGGILSFIIHPILCGIFLFSLVIHRLFSFIDLCLLSITLDQTAMQAVEDSRQSDDE